MSGDRSAGATELSLDENQPLCHASHRATMRTPQNRKPRLSPPLESAAVNIIERLRASTMSRYQILVVIICFFLNMIDGYDVMVMAYAAPSLAKDWALSPVELGYTFSGSSGLRV